MNCLPSFKVFSWIGLAGLLVLGFIGIQSIGPAQAQEPAAGIEYFRLAEATSALKDLEVVSEKVDPAPGLSSHTGSYGYLRIVTIDLFNRRPMPGILYKVYDRNNAVVTEVTSDCSGYIELSNLATGYYRVQPGYSTGDPYIASGNTWSWMFVGAGYRATVTFYTYPDVRLAGIRAQTYDLAGYSYRRYLPNAPVRIYDANGSTLYSGYTNCSGFVDYFDVNPGWYRVVAGPESPPQATPTPPADPPDPGATTQQYSPHEAWVWVAPGTLVAIDLWVDASTLPQATPTPDAQATAVGTPDLTATTTPSPGENTPTPTPVPTYTPTATPTPVPSPTPTEEAGPPPPPFPLHTGG